MIDIFYPLNILNIKNDYYKISSNGTIMNGKGHIMKQELSNAGYNRIRLALNDKTTKKFSTHRLVAMLFVDGYSEEMNVVNHKNGNKLDNRYSNLEWTNNSINVRHAYETGLNTTVGENHHFSVVPDELLHKICKLIENGLTNYEIIRELSLVPNPEIRSSKEYKRWKSYLKNLRTRTFRKDIVLQYNF